MNERNDESRPAMGIAAVVLCGGESHRMGTPKWDVRVGGERMIDRVLSAVSKCDRVVLSVSHDGAVPQVAESVPFIRDARPKAGPLAALKNAIDAIEHEAVVLVPCDVPLLGERDISTLTAVYAGGVDDAVAARAGGRVHPTVGVYRVDALRRLLTSNELASARLDSIVTGLRTRLVDLDGDALLNVNTPDDVATAEDRLTRRDAAAQR